MNPIFMNLYHIVIILVGITIILCLPFIASKLSKAVRINHYNSNEFRKNMNYISQSLDTIASNSEAMIDSLQALHSISQNGHQTTSKAETNGNEHGFIAEWNNELSDMLKAILAIKNVYKNNYKSTNHKNSKQALISIMRLIGYTAASGIYNPNKNQKSTIEAFAKRFNNFLNKNDLSDFKVAAPSVGQLFEPRKHKYVNHTDFTTGETKKITQVNCWGIYFRNDIEAKASVEIG